MDTHLKDLAEQLIIDLRKAGPGPESALRLRDAARGGRDAITRDLVAAQAEYDAGHTALGPLVGALRALAAAAEPVESENKPQPTSFRSRLDDEAAARTDEALGEHVRTAARRREFIEAKRRLKELECEGEVLSPAWQAAHDELERLRAAGYGTS